MSKHFIYPDWPAPANVKCLQTTRIGGFSKAPYDSLNLALHVDDDQLDIEKNRRLLQESLPSQPIWLNQVHSKTVINASDCSATPDADASYSREMGRVCCVLTADCLPVLFCDSQGSVVAAAHAGWRGLSAGILESTVASMNIAPKQLMAWLGPAIGPNAFEVGDEVKQVFVAQHEQANQAFVVHGQRKWLADLYLLARIRLNQLGITQIYGGDYCTYQDSTRFFSYRRDGSCGRMATLIWLQA